MFHDGSDGFVVSSLRTWWDAAKKEGGGGDHTDACITSAESWQVLGDGDLFRGLWLLFSRVSLDSREQKKTDFSWV